MSLTEAVDLLKHLSPRDKAALDRLLKEEMSALWLPDPRNIPQTVAYETKADILLYGGAAGGGKTDLLVGLALTKHKRSVIFRPQYVDLRGIEERLIQLNGSRNGYNGADMVLRRDDRVIELGALALPDQEQNWQGRPHDLIGFDEGAQLTKEKVTFVSAWLRSEDPKQRCRIVIASNPPVGSQGHWLTDWFAPWLDRHYPNPAEPGELRWCITLANGAIEWVDGPAKVMIKGEEYTPLSRTFIPARLDDNPHLANTGYRAQLQSLPEPMRSKLLKGDWFAGQMDHERQVIPSDWARRGMDRWNMVPPNEAAMLCLAIDIAWGGDRTIISMLHANWFAPLVSLDNIDTKDGRKVAGAILQHRRDDALVAIDMTGGWGGSTKDHLQSNKIDVESILFSGQSKGRSKDNLLKFKNRRAEMYWKFREALDPKSGENIALPPDERLFLELTAPTWEARGEFIVVEDKDEIKDRIGASTDRADAVVMAWSARPVALARAYYGRQNKWAEGAPQDDPLEEYN